MLLQLKLFELLKFSEHISVGNNSAGALNQLFLETLDLLEQLSFLTREACPGVGVSARSLRSNLRVTDVDHRFAD